MQFVDNNFIAKTFFGLETVLAAELKDLGATQIQILNRAVGFRGDMGTLYKANLWLRSALRVLVPIASFDANDDKELYKEVQKIDWTAWLSPSGTLAVDSTIGSDVFTHSHYVSLKVKDAVVDQFREKFGERPSVNIQSPDIQIHIHIVGTKCQLFLDSSGDSLHKRGYRVANHKAPLNEVLAAGMLLHAGWKGQGNFVDFMCGSGTLPIEAALIALNIAPGSMRTSFGFMKWPNFDKALWDSLLLEAENAKREPSCNIVGSDIDRKSVDMAIENITKAGLDDIISVSTRHFEKRMPAGGGGIVMINPPYGERLQEAHLNQLHKEIGDHLKKNFAGYDAWIISPDRDAIKHIGLRASKKLTLYNGALECKFLQYRLFKGKTEE